MNMPNLASLLQLGKRINFARAMILMNKACPEWNEVQGRFELCILQRSLEILKAQIEEARQWFYDTANSLAFRPCLPALVKQEKTLQAIFFYLDGAWTSALNARAYLEEAKTSLDPLCCLAQAALSHSFTVGLCYASNEHNKAYPFTPPATSTFNVLSN